MLGWLKLHRQLLEWEWYKCIFTTRLFLHVLMKANYRQQNERGVIVEIGELMTTVQSLSMETGLTVKQVRTCLNRLISANCVACKTTNKYTILSIVNYNKYQDAEEKRANKKTSKKANEGQTKGKQEPTTKNYILKERKNNNIINNIIYTHFSGEVVETGLTFDDFWNHYHTTTGKPKTDKDPALKKWDKLTADERQKAYDQVAAYAKTNPNPVYLKKARTYLEDKAFNDELVPAPEKKQAVKPEQERSRGKRTVIPELM